MRARNIKPGFYKNEELAKCSPWARLLFPGLWMMADKEGLVEDRPLQIRIEVFPCDQVNVDELLSELNNKLIVRYKCRGKDYVWIKGFTRHQTPHKNEKESSLPRPPLPYLIENFNDVPDQWMRQIPWDTVREIVKKRDNDSCVYCGASENLSVDHISPVSRGGDARDPKNLQTLCRSCNSSKHNKLEKELSEEQLGKKAESSNSSNHSSKGAKDFALNADSLNPDCGIPIADKSARKVSLDDLSVDHNAEWLAEKRSQGRYTHHDEHFILEQFKQYCKSKGKKYADIISGYRNAFEWEKCQPKLNGAGRNATKDDRAKAAVVAGVQAYRDSLKPG